MARWHIDHHAHYRRLSIRRDASIGLATMSLDPGSWTKTSVTQLSAAESDALHGWVERFRQKYRIVGFLNDGANPTTVSQALERGYVVV